MRRNRNAARRARRRTAKVICSVFHSSDLILSRLAVLTATCMLPTRTRRQRNEFLEVLITIADCKMCIQNAMQIYDTIISSIEVQLYAARLNSTLECYGLCNAIKKSTEHETLSIQEIDHHDRNGRRKLSLWWPSTSFVVSCQQVMIDGRSQSGTYVFSSVVFVITCRPLHFASTVLTGHFFLPAPTGEDFSSTQLVTFVLKWKKNGQRILVYPRWQKYINVVHVPIV